jgi:hypothetical protein
MKVIQHERGLIPVETVGMEGGGDELGGDRGRIG